MPVLTTLLSELTLAGITHARYFPVPRGACSFHLTSSGAVSFPIGEDVEGEVLAGSTLSKAAFFLERDTIVDAEGNGCWFTPPTYVLQCDVGAAPSVGFSIGCDGALAYNGSTTFYVCENGIGDEVNVYSLPDEGSNCGSVGLTADACYAPCTSSSLCAVQTVTVTETVLVSASAKTSPVVASLTSSFLVVSPSASAATEVTLATTSSVILPASGTPSVSVPTSVKTPEVVQTSTPPAVTPTTSTPPGSSPASASPGNSPETIPSTPTIVPISSAPSTPPVSMPSATSGPPYQTTTTACPPYQNTTKTTPPYQNMTTPIVTSSISTPPYQNVTTTAPLLNTTSSIITSFTSPTTTAYVNTTSNTSSFSTSPTSTSCPLTLPSNFEYPHLIIPVSSSTAAGTSYFGQVSSTTSSLFNFDIPSSDSGKTCTLWFSLPTQYQLQTSSFTLSGSGAVDFAQLQSTASSNTTRANMPGVQADLGEWTLVPGNAYRVAEFECPAGEAVAFELMAQGDTELRWFQDYNPCPIGLYIVPSA